jgi:outer membrane protein OmpA-like peptidoglycan-associated protein
MRASSEKSGIGGSGLLRGSRRRVASLVCVAALLGGCSQVPEWANPVSWWDSMWSSSDDVADLPPAPSADAATASEDKPFPKLTDAPAKPAGVTDGKDREEIKKGLVADRENARYTDQSLRAEDKSLAALQPAPTAPPAAKTAPPPPPKSGDLARLPAAPKPPAPKPEATSKLADAAAAPTVEKAETTLPMAPKPPAPVMAESDKMMQVPSIVQGRRGATPVPGPMEAVTQQSKTAAAPTPPSEGPAVPPSAPARPAVVPAPAMPASPPAAAMPAPVLRTPAPMASPGPAISQYASTLPVGQDQSALAQAFASSVAAQGSMTAPSANGDAFQAPGAAPIPRFEAGVPQIIQQTYNQALTGGPSGVQAGVQMASNGPLRLPYSLAPASIHFRHDSARLGRKAVAEIDRFAAAAKAHPGYVRVVGHASQRTADMPYSKHLAVNFNISLDRANAVARMLQKRGVPAEKILVEARGDEEPIYHEFMPEGEAQNRRVELFLQ